MLQDDFNFYKKIPVRKVRNETAWLIFTCSLHNINTLGQKQSEKLLETCYRQKQTLKTEILTRVFGFSIEKWCFSHHSGCRRGARWGVGNRRILLINDRVPVASSASCRRRHRQSQRQLSPGRVHTQGDLLLFSHSFQTKEMLKLICN